MIRIAKPQDIPAIVDLAVESVSLNPIPVRIDRDCMREAAMECLGPAHFLMVSEIDGEVVAAVAASTHKSFWFERNCVSVLLYYTRRSGEGLKLMREFVKWVKSRSAIKMAIIELEPEADPRMIVFLRKVGFGRQSTNMAYVRGMHHE